MSEPQRTPSKGHTRNKSSVKASRPRSSTKGPLDIDDPLASSASPSTPSQLSPGNAPAPRRSASSARSPPPAGASSPTPRLGEFRPKDFSFLLRPEIYHPLTPLNVPAAFRNSTKQPSTDAPLDELLAKGHFRAAAIAAVQELTGNGPRGQVIPQDAARIFHLLYTRLACLTLIDATSLAAHEVKALEDLNNTRTYVDEATGEHLVPWELRVLNVRLQALGFGDTRRAVMSYHELAREARDHISKAMTRHDNSARELWKARLSDLGIKVASALIEMDDLSGAARHLASLPGQGDNKHALSKALLWLQLGDAEKARDCAKECTGGAEDAENTELLIMALCDMADAEYEASLAKWERLQDLDDEMVAVNTAVCLLYLGRLPEGRDILEKQVDAGRSSHTLLFNLTTMYELCTERNRILKMKLADKVAGMEERPSGWEKANSDFKL